MSQSSEQSTAYRKVVKNFDVEALNAYVEVEVAAAVATGAKVRVLDLADCESIELADGFHAAVERLNELSAHDQVDLLLVNSDNLAAVMPLVKYAQARCVHRIAFTTNPELVAPYLPSGLPGQRQKRSETATTSFTKRLSRNVHRLRELGVEVEAPAGGAVNPVQAFDGILDTPDTEAGATYALIQHMLAERREWPEDSHYNFVLEQTLGESATADTFGPALLGAVRTGQLTGYLKPLFERLLAEAKADPESANQALLKISRILLLYSKVIPERVHSYAGLTDANSPSEASTEVR